MSGRFSTSWALTGERRRSQRRAQGLLAETWEVGTQDCVNTLTDRQMDVLRLMDAGLSNQAIADQLVLSYNTVTGYVKQIFKKLDVTRRTQAVAAAQSMGFLRSQN